MMGRDDALAVVVAVTAGLAAATLAAIVALAAPAPGGASARADGPPGCREWTDGCITCARTPAGPACSTPGIACTRGPVRCTAR